MDARRENRTRNLQEEILSGERKRHLTFTKRLGGALVVVCLAALGFLILDRGFFPRYAAPKAAVEGDRVCLAYQRNLFGHEGASFFVFARGEGWSQRRRFFGDCIGLSLRDDELLLFFEGGSYGKYVGEEWEQAGDWPPGWVPRGSAWVGGELYVVGNDANVRAAVWEDGEWRDVGKGPESAGEVKDLSAIRAPGEELWVVWSDDQGKWLVRSGREWADRIRLRLEGGSFVAGAAGEAEGSFWVFHSSKAKGELRYAEVNVQGEVLRQGDVPRECWIGRISGVEATKVDGKVWVFVTGLRGVKRLYFSGAKWEDGGWVDKVGWFRRAGTAMGLGLLSLMPVLTIVMAAAVMKMQESFRQILMGVKESYLAQWWKRAAAQLLDMLLMIPMSVALVGLAMRFMAWRLTLATVGLWLIYLVCTEAIWGRTLGKAALGLLVVGESGGRAGAAAAVVRNLLRLVDFLPVGYAAGILAARGTLLRQRLGDRIARTVVVNSAGAERARQWEV